MTESVKESSALPVQDQTYSEEQTAKRMEAGLRRAFSTPSHRVIKEQLQRAESANQETKNDLLSAFVVTPEKIA
jgi:hypothetical protein